MSTILRILFHRQPTRLQVCWIEQGRMMKFCGLTEFDGDATVAKWQKVGYEL